MQIILLSNQSDLIFWPLFLTLFRFNLFVKISHNCRKPQFGSSARGLKIGEKVVRFEGENRFAVWARTLNRTVLFGDSLRTGSSP